MFLLTRKGFSPPLHAPLTRTDGGSRRPGQERATRLFAAFLRGYTRIHPLTPTERTAIRYLVPVRHIWTRAAGVTRALRCGWHPSEFDEGWFAELLRRLNTWMDEVHLTRRITRP